MASQLSSERLDVSLRTGIRILSFHQGLHTQDNTVGKTGRGVSGKPKGESFVCNNVSIYVKKKKGKESDNKRELLNYSKGHTEKH